MNNNKLAQNFTLPALIKFTMPPTIMMVFMALYQMVDGVFVSNFVGSGALSAINIVYPAISIIIAVAVMLATGGSAIIARLMGEGKNNEARGAFSLVCIAGLIVGVVFAVVGMIFADQIVTALGATPEIHKYCRDYLWVLSLTCPFAIFQMLFQNFLVTAGKPQLGLTLTIIGGVANILLDWLFVGVLDFQVTGAAIATAIGYAVPAVAGAIYFAKNRKGALYFSKPSKDLKIILRTCSNGSSEMVTNLATALTTFLFNSIMLNLMGEKGVASVTIILYSQFLLTAVFIGFSIGVAPIFSYSYGCGDKKRCKKVFNQSLWFVSVFSIIMVIGSYLFAPYIVGVFSRSGTEVYNIAIGGFRIFAISFAFSGFNIFASALFTAFSNGLISAIISFSRTFVFIIASLLLLPAIMGVTGVWLAVPVAEVLSIVLSIVCFIKLGKKYGLVK